MTMPRLGTNLHLEMFASFKNRSRWQRLFNLFKDQSRRQKLFNLLTSNPFAKPMYGLEWGDPDKITPLTFVRDRYVLPYVHPELTALEIGPGGGRWTRYLLPFRKLYVVDYHQELLNELHKNFHRANMVFIKNNGWDFPGVPEKSVDFVFSFGTFVHFDGPLIDSYLKSIREILRPGGNVVLQYSDKNKIMAREASGFSENTPEKMRLMVEDACFDILEEDLTTLWHSSVVRFTCKQSQLSAREANEGLLA